MWPTLSGVAPCPLVCGRPTRGQRHGSRPICRLQISTIRPGVICVVRLTIQTSANFPATFAVSSGATVSAWPPTPLLLTGIRNVLSGPRTLEMELKRIPVHVLSDNKLSKWIFLTLSHPIRAHLFPAPPLHFLSNILDYPSRCKGCEERTFPSINRVCSVNKSLLLFIPTFVSGGSYLCILHRHLSPVVNKTKMHMG